MQRGMPQTQHPRMQAPSQANAAFQDSRQQQNLLWPQQSQQQQPDQRPPHGGADTSLGRLQRAAGAIGAMQAAAKGTAAMRGAAQDASEAGVGMVFKAFPERPEEAVVQELVQGGSAMREGSVQIGDVLLQVDGEDMLADMSKIRRSILGEIGTFVTMQFLRRTSDGDFEYTLSLLRGSAMYFDQLTQKSRLQSEVDRMRQTMRIVEEDRQNLHTQLEKLEAQSGKEKAELSELRRQLGVAEETLRAEQSALKREQEERMQEEQRLGSIRDQKDQDKRNLEQLRGWLDQAQDKLSGAHESLQATRQHKAEMENRLQQESKTRAEVIVLLISNRALFNSDLDLVSTRWRRSNVSSFPRWRARWRKIASFARIANRNFWRLKKRGGSMRGWSARRKSQSTTKSAGAVCSRLVTQRWNCSTKKLKRIMSAFR